MTHMTKVGLVALAASAIAGCSNIDIDQARKLASAGVTSSTALQTEAKTTEARVSWWREARTFQRILATGNVDSIETKNFQVNDDVYRNLSELLKKRTDALTGLVATYKSFQALADYGATKEAEAAAAGFFASTNSFLKAAQALPVDRGGSIVAGVPSVSPEVAEGLSIGFGIVATEIQKEQIRKTSVALRTGITTLAKALRAEEAYEIGVRNLVVLNRQEFRREARAEGLASYDATLRALLIQYDVDPVKDLDAALRRSPSARKAIEHVVASREKFELQAVGKTYQTLLKLLDDLVQQHLQLEAGRKVDLASLIALAQQIEGYYERINGAGKKTDESK
jgi:hypothetical protein